MVDSIEQSSCRTTINSEYSVESMTSRVHESGGSYLGNPERICLHKRAQPTECRVLLIIITNFIKSLTPSLSKFR